MLLAFLLAAQMGACVPMRWAWNDPASLQLLDGSAITCLVVPDEATANFLRESARARGLQVLVEGKDFQSAVRRGDVRPAPLVAVGQGLWPGVRAEKEGSTEARPTGAPWVETNTGYLRYLRSSLGPEPRIWLTIRPPEKQILSGQRYVQAIGDAAMSGARWLVTLDTGLADLLRQRDPRVQDAWKRINNALLFYETNWSMVDAPDYSGLALLEDPASGALMSGGIVDMIAAKHIPLQVVPAARLQPGALGNARTLLNIDPAGLSDEQKEILKTLARSGVSLVNGPPGWRLSLPETSITFPEDQVKKLEEVWRGVNSFIWGKNFAVRVFGAHSVLSNLKRLDDGRLALHLVNYSDYPVENITIHTAGPFESATLLTPRGPRTVEAYKLEDGMGIDVDKLEDVGILVITGFQPKR